MNRKPHPWRLASVLMLFAAALAGGCGRSGPPRAAIHGRVTVAGQPLAGGRILFTPVAPNDGPAVSARIVGGEYQLSRKEGPAIGANRVEIEGDLNLGFALDDEAAFAQRGGAPLPPDPIPPEYNRRSILSFEVKAGEDNTYDVTVPHVQQMASGQY
jgi:hypothetical protein